MPFRIEPTDVILIILAAMILFGASRLPEIGRGIGRAIVEFRRGLRENLDAPQEGDVPPVERTSSSQPGVSGAPGEATSEQFCTQCGAPNPGGARYCGKCGQLILPRESVDKP
jgi:sec-independent protein translocase protein TatA